MADLYKINPQNIEIVSVKEGSVIVVYNIKEDSDFSMD
jgi:hypothetical protein